jgi:hypothetical protein
MHEKFIPELSDAMSEQCEPHHNGGLLRILFPDPSPFLFVDVSRQLTIGEDYMVRCVRRSQLDDRWADSIGVVVRVGQYCDSIE